LQAAMLILYSLENLVFSFTFLCAYKQTTLVQPRWNAGNNTQSTAFRTAHVYRPFPSFRPQRLATIDRPSHIKLAQPRAATSQNQQQVHRSTRPTELASMGAYLTKSYLFLPQLSCAPHDEQQTCGAFEGRKRAENVKP
jgi:hypothetical protein